MGSNALNSDGDLLLTNDGNDLGVMKADTSGFGGGENPGSKAASGNIPNVGGESDAVIGYYALEILFFGLWICLPGLRDETELNLYGFIPRSLLRSGSVVSLLESVIPACF